MLRHSMALKWFAIGKLVHAAWLGHLPPDEASDFRAQFGDTWHLVQTMLGHRRVETTKLVLWVPNIMSPHATCEYSWIRPPSRTRRRTRTFAPGAG